MNIRRTRSGAFREIAGALTAFMVVMAFATVGFLQMGIKVTLGVDAVPPDAWMAGLSSLASAALGFLIGQRMRDPVEIAPPAPPLPTNASGCNVAGCPNNRETPLYESS